MIMMEKNFIFVAMAAGKFLSKNHVNTKTISKLGTPRTFYKILILPHDACSMGTLYLI
jgi:hypothetical protein